MLNTLTPARNFATSACAALAALASVAGAQTSVLYVTSDNEAGTARRVMAIQGGVVLSNTLVGSLTSDQGPGGISVFGDVRFIGQFQGGGGQMDLNLNLTGTTYAGLPFRNCYDGTSDGEFNYVTEFLTSGNVYRTNRDFSNPTLLFTTGFSQTMGITYNPATGYLYTHDKDRLFISVWTRTGQLVNEIPLNYDDFFDINWRGLAFDPADNTFWITQHWTNTGAIRQVDMNGATLQTIFVPGLSTLSGFFGPLGCEFNLGGGGDECEADFNGDNQVDFFDYLDFVAAFDAEDPSADFNGDNQVDFFDYLDFAQAFDLGCE
jgi:hypothetical protein